MVDRKGKGSRRKTRDKLSKHIRDRGKIKIRYILRKYEIGERVAVTIDPSFHKGMPHPRFHGLTGKVINRRGECYEVLVNDRGKEKLIIVHPAHLRPIK